MNDETNNVALVLRFESTARLCALAAVVLGLANLVGWEVLHTHTAWGFVLAGTALFAASHRPQAAVWRRIHRVPAALLALLGLLTLAEHLLAADLGMGSMAEATAAGLALTGLALLLLDRPGAHAGSQIAALAGTMIGVLAILGYAYGMTSLYGIGAYSSAALCTAAGLVVVNLGVLFVRPQQGLMAVVTSDTVGGVMARRLLPLAVLAPFIIIWLRIQGERRGLYSSEFGVALVSLIYVVLSSVFVWRTAESLRQSDQRRSAADRVRNHLQAELTGFINFAMDALIMVDGTHRVTLFNQAAEKMFGRHASDVLGAPLELLLPQRLQTAHADHFRTFSTADATTRRMDGLGVITGIRANGEVFPVEASISQLDADGDTYLTVILRDITDRLRIEADLRIAATAFEAQVGIIVTDSKGVILRVNRMFTEDTGYTEQEAVGQTPRLLRSGRHDTAFYTAMWESVGQTGVWQGEIWDRRKNGEIYPKWMVITAVKTDEGVTTHYVSTQTDITQRKAAEEEIKHLAFYDPLTHLPNRRLLMDRMHHALATTQRLERRGALMFIDLDKFKTLNDTLGHDKGDLLLQQVAQRLVACVREGDTVSRLGGDEFVVLLENLSPSIDEAASQAETIGEKVLASLNQTYVLDGHAYHCTCSIGVTLFGNPKEVMSDLMMQADFAMYQAKSRGRNALRFFDPAMQAAVTARVLLEVDLREAVRERQFVLHYQAQVDGEGLLVGAEALVRWQHGQRGMVPPTEFIPLAEETGLILPLGHWVLETACRQLARWALHPAMAHLMVAVNISAHQFRQLDFVGEVLAVLKTTGANPQRLKLELTESLLVADVDDVIAKMHALKRAGVGFSLDDFGTGYSSLSYLNQLPLDQIKIDRSFVVDIESNDGAVVICAATISLAHSLKLKVVAEGVETEAQRYFLNTVHHCDFMQGYLFSRPLPLEAFEALAMPAADAQAVGQPFGARVSTLGRVRSAKPRTNTAPLRPAPLTLAVQLPQPPQLLGDANLQAPLYGAVKTG
ncbi:MAG: hypothetical protein A3F78_14970 [Burkholderiales bacterium RIFCSPLOWO2_12_FULL_61_40]|nr:MAG: hypothetical protein A3F78_14970 [Burkholderiales bacterium RIFCSPLOWO2_12_FULL_61_40]